MSNRPLSAVDLVGYVPYYRLNSNYLNNVLPGQLSLLDEVRYFGLSVNGSGAITSLEGSVSTQKNNIASIKSIIDGFPINERPRLNITLGGAGVDSVFSTIAANASLQTTLAQNIAALLNETGATSVDIDWEHPDAGVERTTTYPALLKRIKQEVGANKRVYATVDPSVMINNNVLTGTNAIDGISLMTYDLGWWGNDAGNPYNGEHSLHEYVEDAVDAWTDPVSANSQRQYVWTNASWGNNVPADKLGVGLPFYGKNIFTNAAYTYAELVNSGTPTGNGYYSYAGQTVWIPDQTDIEDRVQLAHDEGLQNVFIWELGQDLLSTDPNSMLRIAADKLASLTLVPGDFNGDTFVDGTDLAQWQGDYGLNGESDADGDGDSDGRDFLIWQQNVSPAGGLVATAGVSVPEPASALLIFCTCSWLALTTRPRKLYIARCEINSYSEGAATC
ncbi:MAG: glycoside hydrolase family 18 protein [Bythopirellula sp.]|nr:glycoside hydrolase family 18 protein [Bythopirellula sp.]